MKVKHLSLLAGAGSLLVAGAAEAALLKVDYEFQGTVDIGGVLYDHYQIFAYFDQKDVQVTGIVGGINAAPSPTGATGTFINHLNADYTVGAGNVFYNRTIPPYGSHQNEAPTTQQLGFFPDWAYDAYATIGYDERDGTTQSLATNDFLFFPGTSASINNFTGNWNIGLGEGWAVTALGGGMQNHPSQFANAGNDYKVLLYNFSILSGEFFEGQFDGIGTVQQGTATPVTAPGATYYFTNIPAPGALALLGLAGLAGARRRRA